MPAMEIGRVCFLSRGRDAGRKAVIVELGGKGTATVFVKGKEKKCNIRHLFPTKELADIKALKEAKTAGGGKKEEAKKQSRGREKQKK